jgi:putative hydrolase
MQSGRVDLHTHTFFSDGELLPSELLRRAQVKGYSAIALSDHGDASNLEELFARVYKFLREPRDDPSAPLGAGFQMVIIPSVELTHVPPPRIPSLARRAKALGAGLVVVHGETIAEPVAPGTNRAAVECADVDILAHPGLLTLEEARLAAQNDVYLEITSRRGHSLTNGWVAKVAREANAKLVVDTDAHSPDDLIDQPFAEIIARGAGLDESEVQAATVTNPRALVERAQERLARFMTHS